MLHVPLMQLSGLCSSFLLNARCHGARANRRFGGEPSELNFPAAGPADWMDVDFSGCVHAVALNARAPDARGRGKLSPRMGKVEAFLYSIHHDTHAEETEAAPGPAAAAPSLIVETDSGMAAPRNEPVLPVDAAPCQLDETSFSRAECVASPASEPSGNVVVAAGDAEAGAACRDVAGVHAPGVVAGCTTTGVPSLGEQAATSAGAIGSVAHADAGTASLEGALFCVTSAASTLPGGPVVALAAEGAARGDTLSTNDSDDGASEPRAPERGFTHALFMQYSVDELESARRPWVTLSSSSSPGSACAPGPAASRGVSHPLSREISGATAGAEPGMGNEADDEHNASDDSDSDDNVDGRAASVSASRRRVLEARVHPAFWVPCAPEWDATVASPVCFVKGRVVAGTRREVLPPGYKRCPSCRSNIASRMVRCKFCESSSIMYGAAKPVRQDESVAAAVPRASGRTRGRARDSVFRFEPPQNQVAAECEEELQRAVNSRSRDTDDEDELARLRVTNGTYGCVSYTGWPSVFGRQWTPAAPVVYSIVGVAPVVHSRGPRAALRAPLVLSALQPATVQHSLFTRVAFVGTATRTDRAAIARSDVPVDQINWARSGSDVAVNDDVVALCVRIACAWGRSVTF